MYKKQTIQCKELLKELIEEGTNAKNELEVKRMALEKRSEADKEKQELFADIVAQQQQQHACLLNNKHMHININNKS